MNKNYSSHEYQYIYWETHILMIHFPCLYEVNWDDWSMLLFFPLHCNCIRILSSKRKINTTPTPVCLLFNSIAVCLFSFTETIQLKCMWNYFHTFFLPLFYRNIRCKFKTLTHQYNISFEETKARKKCFCDVNIA